MRISNKADLKRLLKYMKDTLDLKSIYLGEELKAFQTLISQETRLLGNLQEIMSLKLRAEQFLGPLRDRKLKLCLLVKQIIGP